MRPVSTKEQGHGKPWKVQVEECMAKLKTTQPTSKKIFSKSSHDSSCHYYDKVFGPTATTNDVYKSRSSRNVSSSFFDTSLMFSSAACRKGLDYDKIATNTIAQWIYSLSLYDRKN